MATTRGLEAYLSVIEEMKRKWRRAAFVARVRVGYSAPYARYVHDNLAVYHKNGQAKFLEQPIRTETETMAEIVVSTVKRTGDVKLALTEAAKHLMIVSLPLVPVLTGRLKESWFIL